LSIYSRIQNTSFFKFKDFIAVTGGTIGSFGVDEASGIIMFTKSDGAPFGVQLSTVFHDVLTVPFQVSVSISLLLNPTSKLPKQKEIKSYQCRKG
jgi:hypothetical protein